MLESSAYGSLIIVDPLDTNIFKYTDYGIVDSDSSLNGCVLFTATDTSVTYIDREGFIGVYKNSQIQWMSDGIIDGSWGRFIAVLDLNNDGIVEIVSGWLSGVSGKTEQIWIYSWNGSTASIINDVDESGYSEVYMDPNSCKIQDINGDGIYEIIGKRIQKVDTEDDIKDSVETKVFNWNGSKFGYWPNSPVYIH